MKLTDATALRLGSAAVSKVYLGSTQVWPSAPAPGGGSVATLTIPAGKVASTLSGFVTRVDLSHMPSGWWTALGSDAGRIRVKQAGSVIPFDVVACAPALKVGELFFKAPILTSGANVFTVEVVSGASALAATDPNGRNAVWSDYDVMLAGGSLTNRTGGTNAALVGRTFDYRISLAPNRSWDHPQGVTRDAAGNWYITLADTLFKYDAAWTLLATRTNANAATGLVGTNHVGDGCVYGGELYTVVEKYTNSPYNNQHVVVWNLSDLSFNRSYDISVGAHEAASICRNPSNGHWYVVDFTIHTKIHEYDETFAYVGPITLSAAITNMQGITHSGGYFWISAGQSLGAGSITRVNTDGTGVTTMWGRPSHSTAAAMEGIHAEPDGTLCVLDEAPDRLVLFTPDTSALAFGGFGHAKVTGLPKRTEWAMGASIVPSAASGNSNAGILSYGTDSTSDANRASLLVRGTNKRGALWNSTNTFLEDPGTLNAVAERRRFHHTQNGIVDRKIWRNGAQAAVGAPVAQRPASTGDTLFIGAEDTSVAEVFRGAIQYAYLRNGVLSADWLAAEYASWETPAAFYTVTNKPAAPTWAEVASTLSPTGFYRLGDSAGTVIADSSGNVQHGTVGGTPTFGVASLVPSDSGNAAMEFTAASQYARIPVPVGTGNTVVFTYKGAGAGAGFFTFFGNPDASTTSRVGLFIDGGNLAIQYRGNTGAGTATSYAAANLTNDLEHLVAVTFEAGLQRLFVDGTLVGSTTQTGVNTPAAGVRIGQFSTAHYVLGKYDEFLIYPSILAAGDIAALYEAWSGGAPPPPPPVTETVWNPATMLGADGLHPNNVGMTFLSKVYKKALADAGKTPAAGSTVYAYGDSWTASDFENTPGLRAIQQFTSEFSLTLANRAVSGYKLGDVAARAIGTGAPYAPGASPLVIVHAGVNDLQQTDTPQQRTAIANYLRSLLAVLTAAQRIEQTAFTFAGTWSTFSNAAASGGSNALTTTGTDGTATATFNVTTPGDYYFHTFGANGSTEVGGRTIITQGAATLADVDLNAQHVNTGKSPVNAGYGNLAVKLANVQAGTLTVTHYRNGRTGSVNGYVDALTRKSATPPTILLVKPVAVTKSTYQNGTLLAYMRGLCDTMAAEFGSSVVVADPGTDIPPP